MLDRDRNWELALDQAGSAGPTTLRRAIGFAAIVVAVAIAVVIFGDIRLAAYPQFTTFHAGFVFVVDGIVAFLLFGQFAARHRLSYTVLAAAYLFSALIAVPFLLAFPGALKAEGGVIGGSQSSIWLWHFSHILFPAMVALALLAHERFGGRTVPAARIAPSILGTVAVVVVLVGLATAAVTIFHDRMPVLITADRVPWAPNFYVAGGIAVAMSGLALAFALWAARRRAVLHVWLAVVMTVFLADVLVSLTSAGRFTSSWYFGRIESMIAAGILMLVFLGEISRLYRQLAATVGELRMREAEIRRLAYYDPVTELPNRRLLMDRLTRDLAQAQRHGHATALLFLDLDRFKEINDRLGHEVGDALLHEVAVKLKDCVRGGDTVSRLGGDEFVIVLPEVAHRQDAEAVAEKIIETLDQPISVGGYALHITTSIGIVLSTPDTGRDAAVLLARADAAMYAAKRAGRNRFSHAG